VHAQARDVRGWHHLADWASGRRPRHRRTFAGDPEVDVDVWRPAGGPDGYRLRVVVHGPAVVHHVGAVVSAGSVRTGPSAPLRRRERVLDVPRASQMSWREVGGRGWCSPTSVAMVLSHAGGRPPVTADGRMDVAAAAAEVLDPAYDGTGTWPFNTAWAASVAGRAYVTRLRDLRDAERFVDAGLPLVASVAYPDGALAGAPTRGTDGHLLVVRGFTAAGDVVTNDPAAPTERSVRRTYDRAAFERAWLQGSGGLVYVVHRPDRPPPTGPWSAAHR